LKVLVVGNGAREHAIAWKIRQSALLDELFVAPGNAGTAAIATNIPVQASDIEGQARAAREHGVDLTVIGPEVPLAAGIVDCFQEQGLAVFGPTRKAARIESSKVFAKELMAKHGILTGRYEVFDSYDEACSYVKSQALPLVVKADGLAAGKGVTVARTEAEAMKALHECLVAACSLSLTERRYRRWSRRATTSGPTTAMRGRTRAAWEVTALRRFGPPH